MSTSDPCHDYSRLVAAKLRWVLTLTVLAQHGYAEYGEPMAPKSQTTRPAR
ncbi:MAG TPA: hypothetical protein PLN21_10865 [Gemmatales bacterium]|nr:hypothetical protein [Gemmatales bacterium]